MYDVSAMPITGGPYLQAALLCEKALQETDGVVSVIRIVDRWFVSGPTEEMLQTAIQATMELMFKSGFHRGPKKIDNHCHHSQRRENLASNGNTRTF